VAGTSFVDYVKICCRSGNGGAGAVHFLRDRRTAFGGPDGGDGGRGGHIVLRGNKQLWTLLHLKYRKHVIAEDGQNGQGMHKHGARGKDVILEVPLGTVAKDAESGEILFEITEDGEEKILSPGGRGGLGNDHFKTATRQTPRFAQPGEPGEDIWKILELKVLADVGLVGFPNAGKSTLLAAISAAKPEIADYPFTTITPNLGIVPYHDYKSFIVADIPGIIEGAHAGKGLGHRFLRHIERNSILLFMVPADDPDILKAFRILREELQKFNPDLLEKECIFAISKADLLDQELKIEMQEQLKELSPVFFSAVSGDGIPQLKDLLWQTLQSNSE
jgi:GTPase